MENLSTLLNKLMESINSGASISAKDTISSLINSISSASNQDQETFNNLLTNLTSKIQGGQYSNQAIGDSAKNFINSLHSELTSGKYSTEQIGEISKKILNSMGSEINKVTDSMSATDLGNKVKNYVNKARVNLTSLSSEDVGNRIKNTIGKYSNKIKNKSLTMNDINNLFGNGDSNNKKHLKFIPNLKKIIGTPVAKTTKKTASTVKNTIKNSIKDKFKNSTKNVTIVKKPSSITASISETIYYDHDLARNESYTIQECFEAINRDNKELQSIITDLNSFWRGSLATRFTKQIEEYMELINKYYECLVDGYDNLKNGSKAYSSFDEYFATKNI